MSRPEPRGYRTCIPLVPFWAARQRCEGNTSFACVLTEHSGQQSSIRERTRISFLIELKATKCHDLVSLAPLPSMPHFHPHLCPARTSRFLTIESLPTVSEDVLRRANEVRTASLTGSESHHNGSCEGKSSNSPSL